VAARRDKTNDMEKRRRALALEITFQKARPSSDRLGDPVVLKLEGELEEARQLGMRTGQFDAAAHASLTKARFLRVHASRPADLRPLPSPRPNAELRAIARRAVAAKVL
jgi:hypothetical protein